MNDISACNMIYCTAYKFSKCERAKKHKRSIADRAMFVSYISVDPKTDVDTCEYYIPTDKDKICVQMKT